MAALPYMQLYVADYLADTMHLNVDQHGAYLLLIMNYWQTGKPLPDNDQRLQCVCRTSAEHWQELRPALEEFFTIKDGYWYHNRLDKDLEKVKSKSESARKAAEKRHKPAPEKPTSCERNANAEQSDMRTPSHTDTDTDTDTDTEKQQGAASDDALPAESEKSSGVRDFPTKDGKAFALPEQFVQELKSTYPRIDVEYQLQKARLWLIANPGRQKTRRGMTRFLNNWMGNQKPTAEIHPIQSRHNGFDERDYSEGLIEGVPDGVANF